MKRTVISATDWRFDKPERKPLSESSDLTDQLTEMTEGRQGCQKISHRRWHQSTSIPATALRDQLNKSKTTLIITESSFLPLKYHSL